MGFLTELGHLAGHVVGNVVKINALYRLTKQEVRHRYGVDLDRLPKPIQDHVYAIVKAEYLNGSTEPDGIILCRVGDVLRATGALG